MESDERRQNNNSKRILLSPLILLHKLLGKIISDAPKATEDAILSMVDAAEEIGVIEEEGAKIISNAFEFDGLTASDVMTHRVNVIGVKSNTSLDDIIYLALDKGFSRLPVYRENLDDIIGIIIVKDLLSWIGKSDLSTFSLEETMREAVLIPESGSCAGLFKLFKQKKSSMAIVIDEYGGTAGIVTVEDLVEEIMGSIQDEYDGDEDDVDLKIKQVGEKNGSKKYKVDGEADPEEVLELFGYELPENHEYETIAGFVTDLLGFIPENGETHHVDYKDLRLVATETKDNCIHRIIVYRS
ncbi:MAG: hemolysin family protein [Oscillospiraceae bacterium]|nr:hemolysin family protein [Oscillospiraceae bacterium]